jgi:hypothetical protein
MMPKKCEKGTIKSRACVPLRWKIKPCQNSNKNAKALQKRVKALVISINKI